MFPTAEAGLPPPPSLASPRPQRPVVGQAASGQGLSADAATLTRSEAAGASEVAWLTDTERADDSPTQASPVKTAPTSEIDAWALYGHLQQLHSELHPAQPELGASFADALRHLQSRDAGAAREVQALVKGASRHLKRAFGRLEEILEAPRPPGAEGEEEFDPFEDMEAGEVRHSAEHSAPEKDAAINGSAANGAATSESATTPSAEPATPLSPTRQAAARRTVGRTLRSELQFEKDRFSKAAKSQELLLGRGQEKAMLTAIAAYLELPITSKRDLSSHQWARLASAIETQNLRW